MGLLYVVSALGCALAPSWTFFLVFRFIGGIGIGGSSVLGPVYIAELAPAKWRGRMVGLFQINIVIGILLAYLSNAIIAHFHLAASLQNRYWRMIHSGPGVYCRTGSGEVARPHGRALSNQHCHRNSTGVSLQCDHRSLPSGSYRVACGFGSSRVACPDVCVVAAQRASKFAVAGIAKSDRRGSPDPDTNAVRPTLRQRSTLSLFLCVKMVA